LLVVLDLAAFRWELLDQISVTLCYLLFYDI
jgi:hypothetical protein